MLLEIIVFSSGILQRRSHNHIHHDHIHHYFFFKLLK